jgi:hypothetical protein
VNSVTEPRVGSVPAVWVVLVLLEEVLEDVELFLLEEVEVVLDVLEVVVLFLLEEEEAVLDVALDVVEVVELLLLVTVEAVLEVRAARTRGVSERDVVCC